MATRFTFDDRFDGAKPDNAVTELLGMGTGETKNSRVRKILLKVIKGELTETQQKMIMMYYFKNMTMQKIADETGVSVQAVSAALARARNRLFRILRYYFE